MPTVDIKRAGTDLQRRIAPNNQQFVQTEDVSYLGAIQEQAQKWKQAEDATYVANSTTELQQQVYETGERLKQDFFDNPEGYSEAFQKATEGLYKQAIDNAPSVEARNSAVQVAESIKRSQFGQSVQWEQTNTVARYQERHDEAISGLTNMLADNPSQQNFQDVMAQVELQNYAAESYLSPAEHVKLKARNERVMAETLIRGLADKGDTSGARQVLESGQFDDILAASDQAKLERSIDAIEERQRIERERAVRQSRINTVNDFKAQLANANSSNDINLAIESVQQAYDTEQIDGGQYAGLIVSANKALDKQVEFETTLSRVQTAIETNQVIEDQKDIDTYYEFAMSNVEDPNDVDAQTGVAQVILESTGKLPTQVQTRIHSSLHSNNPTTAIRAAAFITNNVEARTNAFRGFSEDEIATAYSIKSEMDAGAKPEQAVAVIREREKAVNVPAKQARINAFKKTTEELNELITDEFGENVPPQMRQAIRNQTDRNFVVREMTLEAAFKAAASSSKLNWAETTLTKEPTYMYKAPEAVAAAGDDQSWQKEQLEQDLIDFLGAEEEYRLSLFEGAKRKVPDNVEKIVDNISQLVPVTGPKGEQGYRILLKDEETGMDKILIDDETYEQFMFIPQHWRTPEATAAREAAVKAEKEAYEKHKNAEARSALMELRKMSRGGDDGNFDAAERYFDELLTKQLIEDLDDGR